MFKNRTLQMKVVKDTDSKTNIEESAAFASTAKVIEKIANVDVKRVVAGFVVAYASIVAINTASEIAVNYAPKN